MGAEIRHVAITSENYAQVGRFYQALFGLKASENVRPARALSLGDGYVGLNINPRKIGRPAGLDHFGIQVDDVELVFSRLKDHYPEIEWVQRPSVRPFAGISAHDPDNNVFDISAKSLIERKDVYAKDGWEQDRRIDHIGIRTTKPKALAKFYCDVFDFSMRNKAEKDPNEYVSDGKVTLAFIPWHIADYNGTGVGSTGLEHFGFKVENVEAVKRDLEELSGTNFRLAPCPYAGKEGQAWLHMFQKSCSIGAYHLADPDGVPIDISE
jgi:catechol 2,3-dioxygenase-like lactoylglutathione lyase family enzyme